jgi:serine/threonine protein phosphatase PrpC
LISVSDVKMAGKAGKSDVPKLLEKGVDTGFRQVDNHLKTLNVDSGCTANVVVATKSHISCANIGDSRSILVRSGMALALSKDHKPTDEGETDRIKKAGGSVIRGRVCGGVAVSRSFGDFNFKAGKNLDASKQQISCCPDFVHYEREVDSDEFIVVCCDGVWDMLSNAGVGRFVRTRIQAGIDDMSKIGEMLLDYCLEKGSKDNMTCVIVLLPAGQALLDEAKKEKSIMGCLKAL